MATRINRLRPTSDPHTPIEHLATRIRDYLHLPDPGPLYVLLGAVAANMIRGNNVWLMLVGPPSSGGTVLLEMLLGVPKVYGAGSIDSTAAFLSGSGKKDKASDATGGLLREVGKHGAILLKDFTSILSLPTDTLKKIMSVFREAYDGSWSRPLGTDGGKRLEWHGKLTLLAKSTGEIDRHHQISASMGERWVYYRFPEEDGYGRAAQALRNAARDGWEQEMRDLVSAFFYGIGLEYGKLEERRALTDAESFRVIRMAKVAAQCRSAVPRDGYTKEIIGVRETEYEIRLTTVLGQLLVGMEYIGVPEKERWRILGKVSLDSMPALRQGVVRACLEERRRDGVGYEALRARLRCSATVVKRVVEDLEVHSVVERVKREKGEQIAEGGERSSGGKMTDRDALVGVRIQEWIREEFRGAWGGEIERAEGNGGLGG